MQLCLCPDEEREQVERLRWPSRGYLQELSEYQQRRRKLRKSRCLVMWPNLDAKTICGEEQRKTMTKEKKGFQCTSTCGKTDRRHVFFFLSCCMKGWSRDNDAEEEKERLLKLLRHASPPSVDWLAHPNMTIPSRAIIKKLIHKTQ